MIYLLLAIEFFKIGLFAFGGGYATIPFLYDIALRHGWYTIRELTNMTAVASVTPGPIGINVATYAGIKTSGILGAVVATVFELIPSLILVLIISKLLKKFSNNFYVEAILETLRPISCALLVSVAIGLIKPVLFDMRALVLLLLLIMVSGKAKREPLFYIVIGGLAGIIKVMIL